MPLHGKYDTMLELDGGCHETKTLASFKIVPETYGKRRIGIAVIGIGRMGAIHLDNVVREPRANLLYIFDADKKRLETARKKYYLDERGVQAVGLDGWQKILDDKRVEVLFIATPTFTHEKYAKEGIQHNKHVLCEKPLSENPQNVKNLVDLAHSKNLKLICAFNRRHDPSFRRLKQQLARGDIGQLRLIKTCSRDSPLPPMEYIKISGGIFHDCFVHDLDVILWMAQELPTEVHSVGATYDPEYAALGDYDTVVVTMKFKSGLITLTDLSRLNVYGYDQRTELFGSEGMLKIDEAPKLYTELHNEIGLVKPSNCFSFSSRFQEAYAIEVNEIFNHIEGNQTLHPINPTYLSAVCKIVTACEHSAKTKMPVELTWAEGECVGPF